MSSARSCVGCMWVETSWTDVREARERRRRESRREHPLEPWRVSSKRLVIVELVARLDRFDPALHAPRAEIEAAAGNPVALTGQPARPKHLAQQCRRLSGPHG